MAFSQYRGVMISLISRSDIRYEGILDEINPETSSIALINVKSFGTEGRKGNALDEIPPQDTIFPYICFRASDVKDLVVQSENTRPAPPAPAPALQDPAIINYTPATPQSNGLGEGIILDDKNAPSFPDQNDQYTPNHLDHSRRSRSRSHSPNRERRKHSPGPHGDKRGDSSHRPHGPNHRHRHHGPGHHARGGHRGRFTSHPTMTIPKEEFDIEASNAKFHKEDLIKEFAKLGFNNSQTEGSDAENVENLEIPPPQVFYDKKKSFFDNISCEVKERAESSETGPMDVQERRHRLAEDRKLNVETFGAPSLNYGRNWRGRGRGNRGSGYQSRGGRGRGGYNNSGGYHVSSHYGGHRQSQHGYDRQRQNHQYPNTERQGSGSNSTAQYDADQA